MARVFLDTNTFIDAIYRKPDVNRQFLNHRVYVSPLSAHILFYALKLKVPNKALTVILDQFEAVDLSGSLLVNALAGPTADLEDNIQLHSAAEGECDYFLTSDKRLLAMKFFGKTKIVNTLKTPT
jgi:predicted nucleic acid-binding protein